MSPNNERLLLYTYYLTMFRLLTHQKTQPIDYVKQGLTDREKSFRSGKQEAIMPCALAFQTILLIAKVGINLLLVN